MIPIWAAEFVGWVEHGRHGKRPRRPSRFRTGTASGAPGSYIRTSSIDNCGSVRALAASDQLRRAGVARARTRSAPGLARYHRGARTFSISPVWILTRSQSAELASLPACVEAVEAAFRHHGSGGESLGLARIHLAGLGGAVFHMTAGGYSAGEGVGADGVKLNGRFPATGPGRGRRVSRAILLSDAATGKPIALLFCLSSAVVRPRGARGGRQVAPAGSADAASAERRSQGAPGSPRTRLCGSTLHLRGGA